MTSGESLLRYLVWDLEKAKDILANTYDFLFSFCFPFSPIKEKKDKLQ